MRSERIFIDLMPNVSRFIKMSVQARDLIFAAKPPPLPYTIQFSCTLWPVTGTAVGSSCALAGEDDDIYLRTTLINGLGLRTVPLSKQFLAAVRL